MYIILFIYSNGVDPAGTLEVFPSSSASSHLERPITRELSSSKISSKYSAAYQAAEMRRGILSHELEDAHEELSIIEKRKQKLLAGEFSIYHYYLSVYALLCNNA